MNAPKSPVLKSPVLTVPQLAEYLGCHPSTIYRLVKRRQIPFFKIGADYRFNLEAINKWSSGGSN